MFPYFELPAIELGPVTLHAFGILVAAAILLGRWMLVRRAERRGLDGEMASRLVLWMVACGLLGAHLVAVTLSDPRDILQDPLVLIRLWEGLSSVGGIAGGDTCRTVVDAAFRIESLRDPGLSGSGCLRFPLCLDSGAGWLCSGPRPSGNPYRRVVGRAISGRSTLRSRPVGILLCAGSGGPVPVAGSTSQEQRFLLRTLFCALWTGSLLPGRTSGR